MNQFLSVNRLTYKSVIYFENKADYFKNYRNAEQTYVLTICNLTPKNYDYLEEFYKQDIRVIVAADYSKLGDDKKVHIFDKECSIYEIRYRPGIAFSDILSRTHKKINKSKLLDILDYKPTS
jgi:hypothetical protein